MLPPTGPEVSIEDVLYHVKRVIVGQDALLEKMVVALVARGHLLVEGVPGLAKTLAVKTFADALGVEFQRIQFTPDLVPADIVGTRIYNQKHGEFEVALGPIFANLVLADEINRAPAKVQSALLEAMQERQVTIGRETYPLPDPFLVMATQNPIESDGTYPLPEAQVDRFMLKVLVDYPSATEEFVIVERMIAGLERVRRGHGRPAPEGLAEGGPDRLCRPSAYRVRRPRRVGHKGPVGGGPPGPSPLHHLRCEPAGLYLHGYGGPGVGACARPPVRVAGGCPHDRARCAPPPTRPFLRGTGRRCGRAAHRRRRVEEDPGPRRRATGREPLVPPLRWR